MKSNTDIGSFRTLTRVAFFAAMWWLLSGGDPRSWVVGGPVALAATVVSLHLRPEKTWRWRLAAVPAMAWFFLRESVRGGFDVARRALRPSLPLNPGVIRFNTRLPTGSPRSFFAGLISLVPGTLVLGFKDDLLQIHALDAGPVAEAELGALERRVAALFGIVLGGAGGGRAMNEILWAIAFVLLLTIVGGVAYVTTRRGGPESILAPLLFGTTSVAMVLVMGRALDLAQAVDIALSLALLAAVLGVAFVLRGWPEDKSDQGPHQ